MKKSSGVILVLVVALVGFAAGRLSTKFVACPTSGSDNAESVAGAPTPTAPTPSPNVTAEKMAKILPSRQVEVFPVDPHKTDRPEPPPPSIAVPPGTKPANDPSPFKGDDKSPKVIVYEVSDFQCPVCKRAYEPLRDIAKDFPQDVLLVFKQNPLAMHRNAMDAAAASMAAGRQGKFDAYADILFSNQRAISENDLMAHAETLKLDMKKFKKDFTDITIRARARAEGDAATELGARGTPAFFVNGRMQVGWASYRAITQMVEQEIKAVDALVAQGKIIRDARIERVRANLPEKADIFLKSILATEFRKP